MSQTMDAATGGPPTQPTPPTEPSAPPEPTSPSPSLASMSADAEPPPTAAPRERSVLGLVTISLALVAAGAMILVDRSGAWQLNPVVFLAVLLAVVGAGLLVGAVAGRARWLIAVGLVLAVVTAVAAAVPGLDARGSGDISWAPASTTSIPPGGYHWSAGNVTVDLTATQIPSDALVEVSLGVGDLTVLVPADVALVVRAHVGIGSTELPNGQSGVGVGRTVNGSYPAVGPSRATLTLRLDVGVGTVEVRRAQA
jgi:hypothetical protein